MGKGEEEEEEEEVCFTINLVQKISLVIQGSKDNCSSIVALWKDGSLVNYKADVLPSKLTRHAVKQVNPALDAISILG
ncbi:hypothetical protein M8J77_023546 [Diaphorina citri]|nr:hypothetical protein M8J77_023546 [Diaphorina citri]